MAKNFAICRVEKRKSLAQVGRSEGHNLRTLPTSHADKKAPAPKILFGAKGLTAALKKVLPEKRRKDAVLAFEVLLTASPEWFEGKTPKQIKEWEQANAAFLKERFGTNLMQAILHLDEQTPHIHAYCHPVRPDGTLSYKDMLGSPELLRELQDDYAQAMKPFGLRRGLRGRKATHEETKKWRAEQAREFFLPPPTEADVPRATMQDRVNPEPYVKKALEQFWRKINRQLAKLMSSANETVRHRKQNDELLERLNVLEGKIDAEAERANFYKQGLAMLLGFDPDIETLDGQHKTIKAIKTLRKQLYGPEPTVKPLPVQEPVHPPPVAAKRSTSARKTFAPTPFGNRSPKR